MPYEPSVPHMFIVVFVIMLPVYLKTNNALLAWQEGRAWVFIIGIIVLIGAFIGPTIRRPPRAAMLGTLAGISIAFISLRPAFQMWGAPYLVHLARQCAHRLDGQCAFAMGRSRRLGSGHCRHGIAWVAVVLGWSDIVSGAEVSASFSKFGLHLAVAGRRRPRRARQYRTAVAHRDPTRDLQLHGTNE
jgi:adenine/guanine/hypoxanthine permease